MIEIENLNFGYGKSFLFDNLNLSIKDGNIYGLLGKNGAGKTTLLKIMCGLIFPKEGKCLIADEESRLRYPDILKEMFFIPESFNLPEITVKSYLNLNSVFYEKFDKDIFYNKLSEFEIKTDKKLDNLSFGQKKKFLLAFGIASNCKILIFDEPTNGLDIPSKRIIRNHLVQAKSQDRIIIISTHNVKEMESVFDDIIILESGKIIFREGVSTIKEKFMIKQVSSLEDTSNAIYCENTPGGYCVLQKNDSYNKNEIDLEFFFNAVTSEVEKINEFLK